MTQTIAVPAVRATTVAAVVPARGGSKGVPGKNLREVGGVPLVTRAVRALHGAGSVGSVVVSTDDDAIADAARLAGAQVVRRPADLSGDEASSEAALLHALDVMEGEGALPDVLVFVQATSPFIEPADVERAVGLVLRDGADVAFSVTRAEDHLWRHGADGPEGVNHDLRVRLRRQDREPEFRETGAFYVLRTQGFRTARHRFFGRVEMVEVSPGDALEIDTVADLTLARVLADTRETASGPRVPARAVVTDFDGVHTDDTVMVDQDGVETVRVSRSDGMGVALLRRAGVPFLVLSTERNPVVRARAAKLGVDVVDACDDKLTALRAWADARGTALSDVAYLGNDVNDVACLEAVGWPCVVADAHPAARAAARIVLRRRGGDGAVRELADAVLAHALPHERGQEHG